MMLERALLVRLSGDDPLIASLIADIKGGQTRCAKAMPGDRADIVRYELVSTQLELFAHTALVSGAASQPIPVVDIDATAVVDGSDDPRLTPDAAVTIAAWHEAGDVAVELRLPFGRGDPGRRQAAVSVRPPADRWAAPPGVEGKRAVAIRFRQQLEAVIERRPGAVVVPSGVSNAVVTEVFREFVTGPGPVVEAPVVYRDGSQGRPFPLSAVRMLDVVPQRTWNVLHFALLSIRHMDMDVEVDGAWLRNSDISRLRPAGETDDLAFELSRRQLLQVCEPGPCLIYMYQTGLEPAVVGLYRAVAGHLIERPGSLAVVPMFFRRSGEQRPDVTGSTSFSQGKPWIT
jgi:hypothetical protein